MVRRFKELFLNNLSLFIEGKYLEFFKPFKMIKGIDDNHIKEIFQDIQIKIATMHAENFDVSILYTIALSSLISGIREINFNNTINNIVEKVKMQTPKLNQHRIQIELDKLFMKNNENISILYNLSFLQVLAESFNFKSVSEKCRRENTKYQNLIINLILSATK